MPIVWAQAPSSYTDSTSGYGDILRYVSRYGRLDTYDLLLSNFENVNYTTDPERREGWLDRHAAATKRRQKKRVFFRRHPLTHRP
jgi:hypothetical protein